VPARRALALIGFRGSGKSTVARIVAEMTGAPLHELDAMVEATCGTSVAQLFREAGEEAFRALEAELLPRALVPGAVADLGGGAPVADANWRLIARSAVTVWLDAPAEVLLARINGDPRRPPLAAGETADWAWLASSQEALRARLARYRQADHRVDATGEPQEVAEEVRRLWVG
jgi:shikimate kinase